MTHFCVVCGSLALGEHIVLAVEDTPEAAARRKHEILAKARKARAAGKRVAPLISLRVEVC